MMNEWDTYFILDSLAQSVKVGKCRAGKFESRRRDLQTGNPRELKCLKIIEGDHEREVHSRLKQWRSALSREWFFVNRCSDRIFEELIGFSVLAYLHNQAVEFLRTEKIG